MVLGIITRNWFVLFKPEIPQLTLKNFMKNCSTLKPPYKQGGQNHLPSQLLQVPPAETQHRGDLTQAPALIVLGVHPTIIPISIPHYQMVDHFHLLAIVPFIHTWDISKSAGYKATRPEGAPPFDWFQLTCPTTPQLHPLIQPHHNNHVHIMLLVTEPTWLLDSGALHHVTSDFSNPSLHPPCTGSNDIIIRDGSGIPITHTSSTLSQNTYTTPFN